MPSGLFLHFTPSAAKYLADCAVRGPAFPFGRRHKMAAWGGGATVRARGELSSLLRRPGLSREPRSSVGTSTRRTWRGAPIPECVRAALGWRLPHQLPGAAWPGRVRPLWGSAMDLIRAGLERNLEGHMLGIVQSWKPDVPRSGGRLVALSQAMP